MQKQLLISYFSSRFGLKDQTGVLGTYMVYHCKEPSMLFNLFKAFD